MSVKNQKIVAMGVGYASLVDACGVLLFNEPTSSQKLLGLGSLIVALAWNAFVLYGMTKRSNEKGLRYYLQVEWSKRDAVGWEGWINVPSVLAELIFGIWLYIGLAFDLESILPRLAFAVLGMLIGLALLYGSYKFETGPKIYEDRTGFYMIWLAQPFWAIGMLLSSAMVSLGVTTFIWTALLIISVSVLMGVLRFWVLPQRWFGPKAVRQAYQSLERPGFIWAKGWKPPKG